MPGDIVRVKMSWIISRLYEIFVDPLLKKEREMIAESLGDIKGQRILDVACGTGVQAAIFARKGAIVTGIDSDPSMVKVATKKKQKNLSFEVADATKLPFKNDSFYCSSISLGFHEMPGRLRPKVLAEMRRVIKKEGVLIITDFDIPLKKNLFGLIAKSAEFLTNRENFTNYSYSGGLENMLIRSGLEIEDYLLFKQGNIVALRIKNS